MSGEPSWHDDLSSEEREAFVRDELLDIVVDDVGIGGWQKLLDHLRPSYEVKFFVTGREEPLPTSAEDLLTTPPDGNFGLRVRVGNLSINEYFLDEDGIEFDMSPKEILDVSDIRALLSFMKEIGDVLGHEVVMRVEGSRDAMGEVYRFSPGDEAPRYLPPTL